MTPADLDIYYLVGYAYGYNNLPVNCAIETFKEGYFDGLEDKYAAVSPVSNFDAADLIKREIGTRVTSVANPLKSHIAGNLHVYALGYFPELGTTYQSIQVNYATTDRTWMNC